LLACAPARAEVPDDALAVWAEMARVQTLEARFVQIRTSRLLRKPLEARGLLRFERPDRLCWTTESPARSALVMQGSRVGMAWPDLGVSEEVDLAGSPEAAQLVRGMMVWMAADLTAVERDWTVTWTPGEPARALLLPKDPTIKAVLASLELTLGGLPRSVRSIVMLEPDGDRVEITLHDLRPGATLPADAFALPAVR
jgi:outer membrane lipoprotein-sorting protein